MEGDFGYFEVNAVFDGEPVEESTWTAGLRRMGKDTGTGVLCYS